MPCKSWNEEWVAHLYGELEAAEEHRLTEHLGGCSECRDTLEQLESSRRMLRDLAPAELTAPRVVVLPQQRLRQPAWAFAAGLACASVLFAVGALAGSYFSTAPVPLDVTSRPLPSGDLEQVSQRQQSLEARFARLERSLPDDPTQHPALMTRAQVDEALLRLQHRLELDQARNTQFLLEEINATEFRAGRWVDETRQAIQLVALQNDPRFRER